MQGRQLKQRYVLLCGPTSVILIIVLSFILQHIQSSIFSEIYIPNVVNLKSYTQLSVNSIITSFSLDLKFLGNFFFFGPSPRLKPRGQKELWWLLMSVRFFCPLMFSGGLLNCSVKRYFCSMKSANLLHTSENEIVKESFV